MPTNSLDSKERHLDMPLYWGRNKVKWLSPLVSKIKSRLRWSKAKFLSNASRSCLIQTVTNTMANYLMSCFNIPKYFIHKIHFLGAKFWWVKDNDKFYRCITWDLSATWYGGAGIRDLSNMNLSFLSNFVWRILTHLAYYQELFEPNMTDRGWQHAQVNCANQTPFWWSISKELTCVTNYVVWSIEDGDQIPMGIDPWVLGCPQSIPRLNPIYADLQVVRFHL